MFNGFACRCSLLIDMNEWRGYAIPSWEYKFVTKQWKDEGGFSIPLHVQFTTRSALCSPAVSKKPLRVVVIPWTDQLGNALLGWLNEKFWEINIIQITYLKFPWVVGTYSS